MKKKNKSTELDNTDKKLIISDVMCSFTLDEMKKCFIEGYKTHAQRFNMNITHEEFNGIENIFNDWIKINNYGKI